MLKPLSPPAGPLLEFPGLAETLRTCPGVRAAKRRKAEKEVSAVGTRMHKVEVFVDGSLVYTTREPREPFEHGPIREAEQALPYFDAIRSMPQEIFAVMSLNGANKPIKTRWVTIGLLNSNQVHPREVFADVLIDRAASVILAHNHPSGALEPSAEDLALTERLVKAGQLLGIRVLDHLIVTSGGFLSLKQQGKM